MNFKSEKFLMVAMLVSMCVWGISWSSAKVLSSYGTAMNIALIRFSFTFIALYLILKIGGVSLKIKKQGLKNLVAAGALMALYALLFFRGLQLGLPGAAGVLVTTVNPLFAYIIGFVISKKAPSKQETFGLILGAAAGGVLLEIWDQYDALIASGNLYFVLAALTWASMSKFTSASKDHGNAVAFSFWLHGICILAMIPLADFSEINKILTTGDTKFWLNILYFCTINSAGATTVYLYSTTKLGAEKASSFVFMVPLAAAVSSWLIMGEVITTTTIVGGLLGIVAVMIMQGKINLTKDNG